jgi:hypothetical protein
MFGRGICLAELKGVVARSEVGAVQNERPLVHIEKGQGVERVAIGRDTDAGFRRRWHPRMAQRVQGCAGHRRRSLRIGIIGAGCVLPKLHRSHERIAPDIGSHGEDVGIVGLADKNIRTGSRRAQRPGHRARGQDDGEADRRKDSN